MGGGAELGYRDLVIAVGAAHLLRNVHHPHQVGPEGGNDDGVVLHGDFQSVQVHHHILFGNAGAQQVIDLLRLQGQLPGLGNVINDVDGAV